ncbi:MAG: hypothetical protein K2V38_08010, partial [Gemmataceae bacterium]|nr:hypothetical protein [Gemmataceae bacterium]
PMPPQPQPKIGLAPKADGETAKMYEVRKGYSNWYFNALERDKLLTAFKKQSGDFAGVPGTWVVEGTYKMPDREGQLRAEVAETKGDAKVSLKLNVETVLEPLKDKITIPEQKQPLGSGGLAMALYHYHRFLTLGEKGFEGGFAHGGNEPFYPFPADGAAPKSLAALKADCAVLVTKHGSVNCKWYFSLADGATKHQLLGFETYVAKDSKEPTEADPCEVYFHDYKDVGDGRKLPHRMVVRYADKAYTLLTPAKWTLNK